MLQTIFGLSKSGKNEKKKISGIPDIQFMLIMDYKYLYFGNLR